MKCLSASIVLAVAAALPAAVQAQVAPGRFALSLGGGTNGGSVEAAYAINRYVDVRAQGAFIGF